ncbi:cytoplasmic phosphatidylinositol transfer protein 1 isoform X4 [Vombatus ursinus]|uniref:cytoplasmic phosphatidylinositol transfer protein 1 isoform X4 n=1 Tax=Vombatus ursinus TaxID=29139 RepID=UPI000FFD35B7|nr:cytoplasmic phosphatidylinositol transfer protein 1 isoform X4 [Vombatus ursinus]XP_027728444.1 cytoplasmic phosphatidylinositol transfer protein 1 isoform X4 [Vombatus ursinus]XP_027728445.1 cytoplasmic phosphatidylinositol transfer protein 1 isoform X4 [Vombatus ursinus]XP_027728447.1 cytoplasmic phosphatidylinositol transfer protein 1 isoform X4 [Vombatus ursinus]XP_027728448.1 cytoplasmic phosphatidylinositol transfer protein 1 isoform X4 [Vombatus ursinus]XP_027728449.1 cytoplasmic pho
MSRVTVAKGWRLSRMSPLKILTMAMGSSQRSECISTANCLAGLELLFPRYFMLQRRLGTITLTQLQCSFLPKFSIHIETKYEDNKGSNNSIFDSEAKDVEREVCFIDIACDEIPERYYKESEDPKHFKSEKTGRGHLREGWRDSHQPIMCSYKLVTVKFEVWGLQTRVEQFVHKVVRDILLIGHRQAFAWVDEWYDMTMDEVREFERATQEATNQKIGVFPPSISISSISLLPSAIRTAPSSAPSTPLSTDPPEFLAVPKDRPRKKSAPETLTLPDPEKKSALDLPGVHSSDKPCQPQE